MEHKGGRLHATRLPTLLGPAATNIVYFNKSLLGGTIQIDITDFLWGKRVEEIGA